VQLVDKTYSKLTRCSILHQVDFLPRFSAVCCFGNALLLCAWVRVVWLNGYIPDFIWRKGRFPCGLKRTIGLIYFVPGFASVGGFQNDGIRLFDICVRCSANHSIVLIKHFYIEEHAAVVVHTARSPGKPTIMRNHHVGRRSYTANGIDMNLVVGFAMVDVGFLHHVDGAKSFDIWPGIGDRAPCFSAIWGAVQWNGIGYIGEIVCANRTCKSG